MSGSCGGRLDCGGDPLIAAAAADIATHRIVDLGLGRVLRCRQQCRGLHDLAGLAIAALRDIERAPSLLHRMIAVAVEPFDRRYRAAGNITDRGDAGAGGLTVDMDSTGAAQCDTAAVFRPCEP